MLIIAAMLLGSGILLRQFHVVRSQSERLRGVDEEFALVLQAHANLMSFYETLDLLAHSEDMARMARETEPLRAALLEDGRRTREGLNRLPPEVRPDPTLAPTLEAIQSALPAQLEAVAILAKFADWGAVRSRLTTQVRELESTMSALVRNIDREVGQERTEALKNIEEAQRRILIVIPLTTAMTLLFAALLGVMITRSITEPLGRLMEGASALAAGDFSHRVVAAGEDEIARLGSVFNDMVVRLQGLYRELQGREKELQQLVDFVPQVIVVLDSDGKWIHENHFAREYLGLTVEECRLPDVIRRVVHPDDEEEVRVARERGLARDQPFELDAKLVGKDGISRWFLARYNPLVEEGRVRRWYVSATEIESRKQEEERIRQENVRLEERTRIARELHDTLLQTFQGATLHLAAAVLRVAQDSPVKDQLERIVEIMRQGIVEGRSAIQGLRSSGSQTANLAGALSRIQEEFKVQPDIDFRVTVTGRQRQLAPETQDEIYRIGREALVNAFCHSGAKRIELDLEYSESELLLRIRDNGCGIDPEVLEKGRGGHWGLAGMRERAAAIGGLVKISSRQTAGTEVQLSVPRSIGLELLRSHGAPE